MPLLRCCSPHGQGFADRWVEINSFAFRCSLLATAPALSEGRLLYLKKRAQCCTAVEGEP